SYCFCWRSEKACAVEPCAAPAVVVGEVLLAGASVVGGTGVTRRGRVAPDCAKEIEAQSASAAVAAVKLAVGLFMDKKFFIGRRVISTPYGRRERALFGCPAGRSGSPELLPCRCERGSSEDRAKAFNC